MRLLFFLLFSVQMKISVKTYSVVAIECSNFVILAQFLEAVRKVIVLYFKLSHTTKCFFVMKNSLS
jgi:hypothetical protein